MRILIVSQYFWPEQFIINDLVKCLVAQGHQATVLTGKPNYPDGELYPGYTVPGIQKDLFEENIEVLRVPIRPRRTGGAKNLLLNYLSFVWAGLRLFPGLVKGREFDAILVFAISPLTAAIPAIRLKFIHKAHLAVWIQDLWPETLAATGFVRNPILLKLAGWMVRRIYGCSDTLLIQSRAFHDPVARYAKTDKIVYYPNSIEIGGAPADPSSALPAELAQLLVENFCIVFAGNIGRAQAVETLVAAAVELKNLPDCKVVIVGSGGMLEWVKKKKITLELNNLMLPGRFPINMMPQIYDGAAALVVTLKDEEIFSYTVPSKVQAYLAAGKPIVAALNGEGARVVTEAGAGLTCAAEDSASLVRCIRDLYAMPKAQREQFGANGRAYFLEHFEMSRQAKRLVEILQERIAAKGVQK